MTKWILIFSFLSFTIMPALCQKMPSPNLLIGSWQNDDLEVKNIIHSYSMTGVFSSIASIKVAEKGPIINNFKWSAIHDGIKYIYQNDDNLGVNELSYDGKEWNTLIKENKNNVAGTILYKPSAIYEWPLRSQFSKSYNYPFSLNEFFDDPTKLHRNIPLYNQFLTFSKHIRVFGPVFLNGRKCYRMNIPLKYSNSPNNPFQFVPNNVWMAVDNGHFIPWQFSTDYSTNGKKGCVTVISYLKGEWYKDAWFPTNFNIIIKCPQKSNPSQYTRLMEGKGYITVSHINTKYNEHVFRINFPVGAQISVQDGDKPYFKKVYKVKGNLTHNHLINSIILIIAIVIIVSSIIYKFIKMKK